MTAAVITITAVFLATSAALAHLHGRAARLATPPAAPARTPYEPAPAGTYEAHHAYPHLTGTVPDCRGCTAYTAAQAAA